jgi:hypothetical protein
MAARFPDRSLTSSRRVGDTVVLRPTRRQRTASALLKALCAAPLLLALPVATGRPRTVILVVAALSALVAMGIDALASRDIWVRISPTGLSTRSGAIPWWAVDEIRVDDRSVVSTVIVRSFGSLEMTLPAPRNGPTGSNPHFYDEVRLLVANWRRYGEVQPTAPPNLRATLERARAIAESEADVIDLRPQPPPLVERPEPASPVVPPEPGAGARPAWRHEAIKHPTA